MWVKRRRGSRKICVGETITWSVRSQSTRQMSESKQYQNYIPMSILEEMYIPAMMNSCRVKKNEETLFHQFGKHGDLICTRYFCTNQEKTNAITVTGSNTTT